MEMISVFYMRNINTKAAFLYYELKKKGTSNGRALLFDSFS